MSELVVLYASAYLVTIIFCCMLSMRNIKSRLIHVNFRQTISQDLFFNKVSLSNEAKQFYISLNKYYLTDFFQNQ